jgi:hypothetical protein
LTRPIPRRTVIAAGPLALVGCAYEGPYFGGTSPPSRQRLVYANGNEPDVFDPGTYAGGTEMRIINALFDGLKEPVIKGKSRLLTGFCQGVARTGADTAACRSGLQPYGKLLCLQQQSTAGGTRLSPGEPGVRERTIFRTALFITRRNQVCGPLQPVEAET